MAAGFAKEDELQRTMDFIQSWKINHVEVALDKRKMFIQYIETKNIFFINLRNQA